MGTQAHPAVEQKPTPCIARQPILGVDEQVVGYELLFRESSQEDHFTSDFENATGTAIETLHIVGLDVLCDGRLAFINCTQQMLMKDVFLLLPPNEVVIEIQDNIYPDAEVVAACQRLQERGYSIALDNFTPDDLRGALVPFAAFIKVDIKRVSPEQAALLVAGYSTKNCQLVALKVESLHDLATAKSNGFRLFQGYFFRHPERMRARQIPANQAIYLQLLQAISKPEADFPEIEELIKREPSLCYRLLRYLNSPLLGMACPVSSIGCALNLLGERELFRWIRMATTLVMGHDKSSDLVLSSLVRARFCELIAPKLKHNEADLFLMGMLSLMDAILEVPIGVVVDKLSLNPEIKAQLIGGKTGEQTALSPIYDLMVAREAGNWETVTKMGKQLNLSLYCVDKNYNEALRWAHEVTSAAGK
ncbi:MAG TPA: HDOD domain-containing protein [Terriglobales bacterium]|nr:HDOD domain-containing protein [Terriglobales bacterium]